MLYRSSGFKKSERNYFSGIKNRLLDVIDVRKYPQLAEDDKIMAIPTLIKKLPPPVKKIIGDLSDKKKLLLDLDLIPQNKNMMQE